MAIDWGYNLVFGKSCKKHGRKLVAQLMETEDGSEWDGIGPHGNHAKTITW